MKRRIFMIIVCSMALSFLLAGCASSSDTEVDLPEADNVESIQLQFCDDSCTVSEIVDITDDNKNVITVINIHTENQEGDRTVFVYEKNKHYYVEQPYTGIWTATEELYDMVYNYADSEEQDE